jgi:hypothetical protein
MKTNTEKQRSRRQSLKEQGLCVHCGKIPPRNGLTTCEKCGKKLTASVSKWQKKAKKERQGKGLCSCGKPAIEGKKTCRHCNKRNLSYYYKRKELGLCQYCGNEAKEGMTRCDKCAEKLSEEKKQIRKEVFEAYGGPVCACCGETIERFLTVDHINNDGAAHRRSIRKNTINKWLRDNDFPPGFQVLCFNCNMGKYHNGGVCPHND